MPIVKLTKPFVYQDKEFKELNLDYDNAKGSLLLMAEKTARKKYGLTDMYLPASDTYRMILASLLLQIPMETLKTLTLTDCMAISNDVLVFFGGADSDIVMTEMAGPNTETPEMTY